MQIFVQIESHLSAIIQHIMIGNKFFFNIENEFERLINQGAELKKIELPKVLSELFCYQLSKPDLNGSVVAGLGADFSQKLAYTKCLVEYLERLAFFEVGRNKGFTSTNGIAGHFYESLAEKNANAELLERDSFLLHWYSQTPFLKLQHSVSAISEFERNEPKYKIDFFQTFLGELTTTCCFITDNSTGGFVLGLSSGKKTQVLEIEKAFSEAIINLHFGSGGRDSASYDGESLLSLSDHRNYWLNRKLPAWVSNSAEPQEIKYNKLPHSTISSFTKKYGNITISGVAKTNLLGIKIGRPDTFELMQLKSRIVSNTSAKLMLDDLQPHPIP